MLSDILTTCLAAAAAATALFAIETACWKRSLFSLTAAGILASLAFLNIGSPGLALLQILATAAVAVLLLRLAAATDDVVILGSRDILGIAAVFFVTGIVAIALYMLLGLLPPVEPTLGPAAKAIPDSADAILVSVRPLDLLVIAAIFLVFAFGIVSMGKNEVRR
ncbi:MAG: hypothetical protein JW909_03025 [Planctomycetes bacterium]|nr:hypothetical protein [Planctomycetota bacterium]